MVAVVCLLGPPSLATPAPLRNAISAEFSMISTDILCMNIFNDAVIALHSNGLDPHISRTKQAFALQT